MATQTYLQLQKEIAALQTQAEKLKAQEVAGVVTRIKEAITAYGLTPEDVFGGKVSVTPAAAKGKGKGLAAARYVDGKGGQWVGRGKRPTWLRDALAAGKRLEDFLAEKFESEVGTFSSRPALVVASGEKAAPSKTKAKRVKTAAAREKRVSSARYSDGAGNSWSGFGPTPKWLKEALAAGKTKEDLLVKG